MKGQFLSVTMPPQPRVAPPPDLRLPEMIPLPVEGRRCVGCGGGMVSQGVRILRLVGPNLSDGAMPLEMFHCPDCGRVDFSAAR